MSKISVSGAGIATGGTFNAATATPGYTAYSGEGSPVERSVSSSLGTQVDLMVVPTGTSAAVTFTVTVDGTDYTATSSAVALQMGAAYAYTLTLNSSFLAVSSFGVAGWSTGTGGSMVLDKYNPWDNLSNGVYGVSDGGLPVEVVDADESCIAVALVAGEHKFMIAKNDATDSNNSILNWGENLYEKDVAGITDIWADHGYFGDEFSNDFNTWLEGALSDFAGKANTAAIIKAYTEHSVAMVSRDMCSVLNTFNAAADGSNAGKNDWYIPACGQLGIMYLAKSDINTALEKIGGTALASDSDYYWSSTEFNINKAWVWLST